MGSLRETIVGIQQEQQREEAERKGALEAAEQARKAEAAAKRREEESKVQEARTPEARAAYAQRVTDRSANDQIYRLVRAHVFTKVEDAARDRKEHASFRMGEILDLWPLDPESALDAFDTVREELRLYEDMHVSEYCYQRYTGACGHNSLTGEDATGFEVRSYSTVKIAALHVSDRFRDVYVQVYLPHGQQR